MAVRHAGLGEGRAHDVEACRDRAFGRFFAFKFKRNIAAVFRLAQNPGDAFVIQIERKRQSNRIYE